MTTSGLLAALIAGSLFSVGSPDPAALEIKTPQAIVATVSEDTLLPETAWWTLFGDPVLDACVATAFERNANLDMALARVEQARAVLGETRSYQSPTLDVNFESSRGRVVGPANGVATRTEQDANLLVGSVNYELDLFGRLRKGTAAALADWLATQAARNNVRLVLAADVTRAYFTLRCTDEQLQVLRETLAADRETLEILRYRYVHGKDSELEYQRFLAETASVERQVRAYENILAQNETALLVLMGMNPKDMTPMRQHDAVSVDVFPKLPDVPVGLSAEILDRRPDLMQARQEYVAAVARVGKADAERYPSLNLNFLVGNASGPIDDLFTGPTGWSILGQLAAPIFDAGRRTSRLRQAEAKAWEALANYEQTARVAFQEISDALVNREKLSAQAEQLYIMGEAQSKSYTLATSQFQGGKVGQLDVLDAHRNLLQVRLEQAGNHRDQLNAAVQLCMALGGGWDVLADDDLQLRPTKKRYLEQKQASSPE
ncbi:efflux transporter outer membrane subunit [Synergistaceae bacterium OttesenSCG-928-D05]|nr:efflux transporter outer membrane subunit [Synergistaceae bacterium OttesenSCG-928-D05]